MLEPRQSLIIDSIRRLGSQILKYSGDISIANVNKLSEFLRGEGGDTLLVCYYEDRITLINCEELSERNTRIAFLHRASVDDINIGWMGAGLRSLSDALGTRDDMPADDQETGDEEQRLKMPELLVETDAVCDLKPFQGWLDQISKLVSSFGTLSAQDLGNEITQWRCRINDLTRAQSQLKSADVRRMTSCMNKAGNEDREVKEVLRKLRALDGSITEAASDCTENIRFLTRLDISLEAMAKGGVAGIEIDPIISNLSMIQRVSRYYSSEGRMVSLLSKVSAALVKGSKSWLSPPMGALSIKQLRSMGAAEMELQLSNLSKSRTFFRDYEEKSVSLVPRDNGGAMTLVFGDLNLFTRRLSKVFEMLAFMKLMKSLGTVNQQVVGLEAVELSFNSLLEFFDSRGHDLLDHRKNKFDRDYSEWDVRVDEIEKQIAEGIRSALGSSSQDIIRSLKLLTKLESLGFSRYIVKEIESQKNSIAHRFGQELILVQDMYEKFKSNPPIGRDLPPVTGHICWSRNLLRRVEAPIIAGIANLPFFRSKSSESRSIIKLYNKLARTLIEYETIWFQAWINSVDEARSGLHAPLIAKLAGGELRVNFDDELRQLIRESKCLDRLEVGDLPDGARLIVYQEKRIKKTVSEIENLIKKYNELSLKITKNSTSISKLLTPHLESLDKIVLKPAMYSLSWTSLNIENYLTVSKTHLGRLESLVGSVYDCIQNRIESSIRTLPGLMKLNVDNTNSRSSSLEEFEEEGSKAAISACRKIAARSSEIEIAVRDLCQIIISSPPPSSNCSIPEAELVKLQAHYHWNVYHAVVNGVGRAILNLRTRTSKIESRMILDGLELRLQPSLTDIQASIIRVAVSGIIGSTKLVPSWSFNEASLTTFFDRIVQEKDILKALLQLVGSVSASLSVEKLESRFQMFNDVAWLWQSKPLAVAVDERSLLRRCTELVIRLGGLAESRFQPLAISGTSVIVSMEQLGQTLRQLAMKWKAAVASKLHTEARGKLESITDRIGQMKSQLSVEIETGGCDIETLNQVMTTLNNIRQLEIDIDENHFDPISILYSLLDPQESSISKEEQDALSSLRQSWSSVIALCRQVESKLTRGQKQMSLVLQSAIESFKKDIVDIRAVYDQRGPMVPGIDPREAVERLRRFKEEFEIRTRKSDLFAIGETLFGLSHQSYPVLDQTRTELGHLSQLYDLFVSVNDSVTEWKSIAWSSTECRSLIEVQIKPQLENYGNRCRKLPKQLKDWPAYVELRSTIDNLSEVIPLLIELTKKSIMPRHWEKLMGLIGLRELSSLGPLLDSSEVDLVKYKDEIIEMSDSADKELVIETKLLETESFWSLSVFDFASWKSRDCFCVLAGGRVAEVQEQLEESLMSLNTMNSMRHSLPFREKLGSLLSSLSDTMDVLEKWTKVQLLWTSLESVFTGGDIAKQMPIEAKKFQSIDKDWIRIMSRSAEIRNVVTCCQSELLRQLLPSLFQGLEVCQKSLENYLEQKRNKFPRFYFVSDAVLLKILSQGGDPENIQDDLEKLFDAINRLVFDKADKRKILKIKSIVGNAEEVVDLSTPVMASGNIEDWLTNLESEMQKSVRRECRLAAQLCNSGLGLIDFSNKFMAQIALLGIQLIWTSDFQDALAKVQSGDKSVMVSVSRKFQSMLNELVTACLSDLGSRMNRTKFETLVTIHVHQRDLFLEIWKKIKENKTSDFEWFKQTRFYWKPEVDHAVVSIADVDFTYSYEYLGVKERLVITPLTDKCFLTLSQALGICYGGAPAGPAGTGKTETVKDMARTLGLYCVVTNCSDQHRYRDMAKIFKGLCSSGIFGCFDEFNRIDLEVLSVVAMQVEAITMAKKQHAKSFLFPGESVPIRLVPSVGYFITMNPGYAGRQELPENLKNLFRSVSMMVPDREIIMRVKLASVGFSQMDILGKKFNVLYQLCEQQLSKQRHYDFGLRNILSVLRTAGGVKRSEPPDTDEELLFMRTVRDMNLSKLVADDVPLFLALLKDLFPRVADPPKKSYADIEAGIDRLISDRKLIGYEPWKLKAIQLYETSLVRHGLMLVGPTLSGKSEIINILTTCLTEHANSPPHRIVSMNPKAITDSQMYGVKDQLSDEWTPGVFSSIWQKYNNRSLKYTTWIVCDGPVDAIWIENLNSVLDDNKILTLANNDRIPMTDNCRILFEVENLNNASPATVSRAGIIFVSESDLAFSCLIDSWLLKSAAPATVTTSIKKIIDRYFNVLIDFSKSLKRVLKISDSIVTRNFLDLLSGLLLAAPVLEPSAVERTALYAMVWAVGGLLDTEDRIKLSRYLYSQAADIDSLPKLSEEYPTIFEFWPDAGTKDRTWSPWRADKFEISYRETGSMSLSNLLIPTMDSVRSEYLMSKVKATLLLGLSGTAKTSTGQMYLAKTPGSSTVWKRVNLSSSTTPFRLQRFVESEVERKTGKTFCPPGGKKMILFIDDLSMPLVNQWGDQAALELLRQLMENSGFYFLDKEKRGDFKSIENLEFVGSMVNPGGGRNDIPNRLKSKFFSFSLVMPSLPVVDAIYGSILRARFADESKSLLSSITTATIDVWERVKKSLLPTPQRFHYVFNMRDLTRVFQGILDTPGEVLKNPNDFVSLWQHECTRVFSDKLAREIDKTTVDRIIEEVCAKSFPDHSLNRGGWWADFQRAAPMDDATGEELAAPKIYEPVMSLESIREKAYKFLTKFNEQFPSKSMNLVLFDDALFHLMKIVRILQQKRGSAMLVGVGGSGKQSLARLAAFICNQRTFKIAVTKSYNENAFLDDIRSLYVDCAQKNNHVTFLLGDSEIKSEEFLEHMNSLMATGEIAGLFQKDERESMCNEVRDDFRKHKGPEADDSLQNLQQFLADRLRDNLHIVYCFSPINSKFSVRAQKFPAVFSNSNIDWFLPWPSSALTAVGTSFLSDLDIDADADVRNSLYEWMSSAYSSVNEMCNQYYRVMRRRVYVTPKNFLCLIDLFKQLYLEKFSEVNSMERAVNAGLTKLGEAAADVERLKVDLVDEEQKLKVAEIETNSLLAKVQSESVKAETKAREVGGKRDSCLTKKAEIESEQAEAERDLQAALPFLKEAEEAVKSITAKDITELKTLKQPSDIIRLVFDGLLILQQKRVCEVKPEKKSVNKQSFDFIHDSYDEIAKSLLTDIRFLPDLFEFSDKQKDNINDETCELLQPYLSLANFSPAVAKKASGAAEGLCKWVGAMVSYHHASLIVKPKMDYLKIQESKLAAAMADLKAAEMELEAATAAVADLNKSFTAAMERKVALENSAKATRRRMDQAEKLISGLSGEKIRWGEDSKNFANKRKQLVGDVGLASVFITFCGAFNSEYREKLLKDYFIPGLRERRIPFTENLDLVRFLVDQATIGEWAMEGLPSDDLSVQNAIMVTKSSRFPLMIDPQGQAVRWIKARESKRINRNPSKCVSTLTNPRLKDQIEFTMGEGLCLLIENVENEVDPILDPLLDKAIVKKGRNLVVTVSDQQMDYNPAFSLYMTSRLPNPHFSPELSARCAVIDFTVTLRGLEQQLLGRVLGMEQKALEESLTALTEEVTVNTKSLQLLDKQLLQRLSDSSGNLLDDLELIEVLANTKQTAKEVEVKLKDSEEKQIEINLKREQYRPVATRGSVLYFCMTDMTQVVHPITQQPVGWMYNSSLVQFLDQFDLSVRKAEKSQQINKRVEKIVDYLTYQVYRYVNRGLFERDKILFKLILALRTQLVDSGSNQQQLSLGDVSLLLRAGSALDLKSEKSNPFSKWMPDKVWLNLLQLSRSGRFGDLTSVIAKNEQNWKRWFDDNEPESIPIPDLEHPSPFLRCLLVRCIREDRTTIAASDYVGKQLDGRFTKPVTDSIESVYADSSNRKPIMYLLSAGSDPTSAIDDLAKKRRRFPTEKVSMGEGQEVIAYDKLRSAFLTGSWVVLQNCHLGLGFMAKIEDILTKTTSEIDEEFRLWITCEVTNRFPIGLLQMSIKVTMEPPMGLKAGLARTYTTTVSQDLVDKIDHEKWRRVVFALSFIHSIVQERRKFGPIGWCIPYEFNNSDLEASLLFLEKHVATCVSTNQQLSWSTIQYMIAAVQYGGRITDNLDCDLFDTFASRWLSDEILKPGFTFSPKYAIPDATDISSYREYIDALPSVDSPMIFGLHPNADLSYRQLEASMLLGALQDTQPKDGAASSVTKTRDEIVKEKAAEILSKLPTDFVEDDLRAIIGKHKGAPGTSDRGFQAPLNIFLFQELQRVQKVISIVRSNLTNLVNAIDGNVVMTPDLLEDLNMIVDAKIPRSWTHDAGGAEISWLVPNLGAWFTGLLDRVSQLSNWLNHGRLKAYWLPGFLNPQGFLTAMRQEVTRQHKKDHWALDDVVTESSVLAVDLDKIKDVPDEGQNIYGLFLEGAKWNKLDGKLEESEPKKLFCQMPVIHVTAVTLRDKKAKGVDYGPFGPFECPVYKYPKRTDKYLVMRLNLKTDVQPSHWRLRGVAALCSTE